MPQERDTADYEESEARAIASGKAALAKAKWLHSRAAHSGKGFFVELRENLHVHPNHYAVHCVDGVGTKLFLAPWSSNWTLQPKDGIAMNANDMATVLHAYPAEVDLYFAVQTEVEEQHMGEIMTGFVDALEEIRIPWSSWDLNLGKIETASLDEMISLGVPNKGLDVGIVMTGYIEKEKVPNLNPKPGNIIIGIPSTGLHSNGYTSARHVLFSTELEPRVEYREEWKPQYRGRFRFNDKPDILEGKTVLEALQVPTAIYLKQATRIGKAIDSRAAYGVNITGNGLHNFNRAGEGVSFEIIEPLKPLPIHMFLVQESDWNPQIAYRKQNMGMGFAYIAPDLRTAERIVETINTSPIGVKGEAKIIGEVAKARESDAELRTTLHKPYEGSSLDFVGYAA